ncbi:MAG: peptidoglycan DD-metalloendopeptidase family protein [Pseudorhodoplanes sp.]
MAETVPASPPANWPVPQTESFRPDWDAVRRELPVIPQTGNADRLSELTTIAAEIFPAVARSPVPVLLPFAIGDYAHDRAADSIGPVETYSADFQPSKFFLAGPTGYDATFALRPRDVDGLDDIVFREPVVVQLSAFNMLYRLPAARGATLQQPGEIEKEFPGIKRQILEHTLRYSFERYGIPYVVTIQCFDSPQRKTRLACRNADRIATRFLRALRLAGGNPAAESVSVPPAPLARPEAESKAFSYHPVGKLIPGTGMRAPDGDFDKTVYARIRFPAAEAPAYVSTQIYRKRDKSQPVSSDGEPEVDAYRWRDNFCEKRDFQVGQCPSGRGHQGQDITGLTCHSKVDSKIRCRPNNDDVVAVRDGMIQRESWNESFFLVVNAAGERMRFRHLHMHPKQLDSENIISGATVKEGQPIGKIGNYDRRPGLTSTHLHFELQVPTRDGFVRVNPYMTLIAGYEHLIGARGKEYAPLPPAPEPQDEAQNPESLSADHATPAVVAVSAAAAAKVATEVVPKAPAGAKNKARAKEKRKAKSRSAKTHGKKRRAS